MVLKINSDPRFYLTTPKPCPYLVGRMERKVFAELPQAQAAAVNSAMIRGGYRRSRNVVYRPACANCASCLPSRIDIAAFTHSRSQRRVIKRNAHLERHICTPWASIRQYRLFRSYLESRHPGGGMQEIDFREFSAMVEDSPAHTVVVEYVTPGTILPSGAENTPQRGMNRLVAACLTDILDDGLSMVYSFFDPEEGRASLGTHTVLDHIQIAREAGLRYLYLGYHVPGSAHMQYKARFAGFEILAYGHWRKLHQRKSGGSPPEYHPRRMAHNAA